jgi:hypothetical protein
MAIPFATLFGQLGPIFGIAASNNTHRGTTMPAKFAALEALFTSTPSYTDGYTSTLSSFQGSGSGLNSAMQQLAQAVLVDTVTAAVTLPDSQLSTAMNALISGMLVASESVATSTVGATVTPNGSNTGNPTIVVGTLSKLGFTLGNTFAETVTATCTADAQSGGATPGREVIQFRGQPAASGGSLNYTYPAGSGASTVIQCISPSQYLAGGTANFLNNGDFENWTVAVPNGWTVDVGAAQISQSTAQHYDGLSSLKMAGDSSTLTALHQTLTAPALGPLTQYVVGLQLKVDVVPAAGVLEIALTDASGVVLLDFTGAPCSKAVTLSGLTTSFVATTAFFRTPRVLAAGARIRLRLTTALSTGSNLFIDHLALAQPTALYAQGPYIGLFSGSTNLIAGDSFSVAMTNSNLAGFQGWFDRAFGMKTLGGGMLLPVSGSPTRLDSLIA